MNTHRIPIITTALSFLTVVCFTFPQLNAVFELNFHLVESGQWWRLVTGHFTHWSLEHCAWDLLVFCVLSASLEMYSIKTTATLLLLSAFSIGVGMYLQNNYDIYRGLSGIDSALFVYLCLLGIQKASMGERNLERMCLYGALVLFMGKTLIECCGGYTFFVHTMGDHVQTAPFSHILGAICAIVVFILNPTVSIQKSVTRIMDKRNFILSTIRQNGEV